jgi:hypothetical protein
VAAVALGWASATSGAKEAYTVDTAQGIIHVTTTWIFARRQRHIPVSQVGAVRMALHGSEYERRVVEFVAHDGTVCLRMPRRGWRVCAASARSRLWGGGSGDQLRTYRRCARHAAAAAQIVVPGRAHVEDRVRTADRRMSFALGFVQTADPPEKPGLLMPSR